MIRHSERSRRGTTVLVVSASPLFEKRTSQVLQESGFVAACAFEWEAAWLSVTRTQPGIVLVDGASTAGHVHEIAAEAAARGIPILLAHGTADSPAVRAAARGWTPHAVDVAVPMTVDSLRTALQGLFEAAALDPRARTGEGAPSAGAMGIAPADRLRAAVESALAPGGTMLQRIREGAAGMKARWSAGRAPVRVAPPERAVIPSPASTASRESPLLVLHDGHAMRCWPTAARPGTRMHNVPRSLDWAVEIDGMVERLGPPSRVNATSREVVAKVRQWWNATRASAAGAHAAASRAEG